VGGGAVAGRQKADRPAREKARHREILLKGGYDVLLAPVQVERNGFDQAARSLMTRRLDARLRRGGHRLPSPTLVARALGEGARNYEETDLFRLANDMNVRALVVVTAGHDLEERLYATVVVHRKPEGGALSPGTPGARLELREEPFGDETPPEEAFRAALDARLAELPLKALPPAAAPGAKGTSELAFPGTPGALAEGKDADPIGSAFRLQLLGVLSPPEGRLRESLFARSLLALEAADPAAPDARLLRARALFHLHRRPASVALLPQPDTPEEKALAALQDGDLPGLEKRAAEIQRPMPRLMAELETNDLRWEYDTHLPRQEEYDDFRKDLPAWRTLFGIRLQMKNGWNAAPVLLVKAILDNALPVAGFTADAIASGQLLQGRSPYEGEEVDFSVETHRDRLLQARGRALYEEEDFDRPVERDLLDLLREYGETNLVKRVRIRSRYQKLPGEALRLLDTLEPVFGGDPVFSYERAHACWEEAKLRQEDGRNSLRERAKELAAEAFFRIGGQTPVSDGCYELLKKAEEEKASLSVYQHDYPRRPYWTGRSKDGDRKRCRFGNLSRRNSDSIAGFGPDGTCSRAINLLYTDTGFRFFRRYFDRLVEGRGGNAAGDRFVAVNPRRFAGYRDRPGFLAKVREKRGDAEGARGIYREAVSETPDVWEPRHDFGEFLMRRGELKEAFELFLDYPLFAPGIRPLSVNDVAVSNYAADAGNHLLQRGALEQGARILRISAARDTGAGSEMGSRLQLAFLEGNMGVAAAEAFNRYRRYETTAEFGDYLSLLLLMEPPEKGWSFFDTAVGKADGTTGQLWAAVEVGLRREGKDPEAVSEWFRREPVRRAAGADLPLRLLHVLATDRAPDPALPERIRDAQAQASPDKDRKAHIYPEFAEGYLLMRQGKAAEAFVFFRDRADFFRKNAPLFRWGLPYAARAAAESGRAAEIEPLLEEKEEENPFAVSLARAIFLGKRGEHGQAIERLKNAVWNSPGIAGRFPRPFYELLETAEWLHETTKAPEYRAFLLEWARTVQRINPTLSWAYAFEARHADHGPDRQRALALALHTDPRSERIAGIPEEEKGKAREWLARNNPFVPGKKMRAEGV
jgi:hypothetical protein